MWQKFKEAWRASTRTDRFFCVFFALFGVYWLFVEFKLYNASSCVLITILYLRVICQPKITIGLWYQGYEQAASTLEQIASQWARSRKQSNRLERKVYVIVYRNAAKALRKILKEVQTHDKL